MKKIIHHKVKQLSDEWHTLRIGKFTASNFGILFGKKHLKPYQDLIKQIAFERLTGEHPEQFTSFYMNRGIELEPLARTAYETLTFNTVKLAGFFERTDLNIGASPDGLIEKDGILEIKAPAYNTLIDYHITQEIPPEYYYQIQGQLFITNRKWCDFFAYHPKLKPFLQRCVFHNEVIERLITELETAEKEVKKILEVIG